ncbi:uncharacterized protein [Ptychodera flava]|uniref:uncharacterized protein n=1 Tax=Ptychodera flava TaxID=63121 RepID=UPI00396A571F
MGCTSLVTLVTVTMVMQVPVLSKECYTCDWDVFGVYSDQNCVAVTEAKTKSAACEGGRVCKYAKTFYRGNLTVVSRSCIHDFMCVPLSRSPDSKMNDMELQVSCCDANLCNGFDKMKPPMMLSILITIAAHCISLCR